MSLSVIETSCIPCSKPVCRKEREMP